MRRLLILLMLLSATRCAGQRIFVVADIVSHHPVAHASVYCKENGAFHATMTDNQGIANVGFPFRRLTISHLCYDQKSVRQPADTVWLTPKDYVKPDVIIINEEPDWIKKALRRFVKEKPQHYMCLSDTLRYESSSQSFGKTKYYHYAATGFLLTPSSPKDDYQFEQSDGLITSVDTSRLTDVTCVRRMLYEDFVRELDNGFIRDHRFSVNKQFAGGPNEVEIVFRNKSLTDDHGHFVMDTARCLILSASRFTGVGYNRPKRMAKLLYNMERVMSGYKVKAWDVDYAVTYAEHNGQYHPSVVRYKLFFDSEQRVRYEEEVQFRRETGFGFLNMESELRLSPTPERPDTTDWTPLHRPWYLTLLSNADRDYERQLSHLPARWEMLKDDE